MYPLNMDRLQSDVSACTIGSMSAGNKEGKSGGRRSSAFCEEQRPDSSADGVEGGEASLETNPTAEPSRNGERTPLSGTLASFPASVEGNRGVGAETETKRSAKGAAAAAAAGTGEGLMPSPWSDRGFPA